jgi:biotin carboxyl carrier protein
MARNEEAKIDPSSIISPEESQAQMNLEIMHRAMALLCVVNEPTRFMRAAMAFCNELAAQWKCERVSLGLIKGKHLRLKAMSHCEHISRKMQLIQDIESTMEECFDQQEEITFPTHADAMVIAKAASHLSQKHGPSALLSVPLYHDDHVEAVITLERPMTTPFDEETIHAICMACRLCSVRLLNLKRQDRWFGARWIESLRTGLGFVFGIKHTWIKLATVLIFCGLVFLCLGKGMYRSKSSCVVEATVQQNICAPFDGFIKAVHVEVGDDLAAESTVLAELDTADLRLKLGSAQAEKTGYLKQVDAYMRDGKTAEAQVAEADSDKVQAQIELFEFYIDQAQIKTPIQGRLVAGDLKRQIGAPVKLGDILFEVTPLDTLRAQVLVSEDQILDIKAGQSGRLATVSFPDQKIPFVVENVSPMAEVVNNRNVFKVRVQLQDTRDWMRPGMEGVAKIDIEKRRYVWIWTRKLVNWIRLKFWF